MPKASFNKKKAHFTSKLEIKGRMAKCAEEVGIYRKTDNVME
jgi:hypothetical protein